MLEILLRLVFLAPLVIGVLGQSQVIQVDVGIQGSFYNPTTVEAAMNNVVQFVFGGDLHDVTQSSFEEPCIPLPGGFSSGLFGRGSNFSNPTPVWNLEITNVSGPIWFFCGAGSPTLHCASGMVGAINPPSQAMYDAFVVAAKNFSPIATAVPSFVASGQGAFATNSPVPVSSSISLLPLTSTSTTSTTAPSQTTSAGVPIATSSSSSSSRLGPIVGGSVGGAVVFVILIIIIVAQRRNNKRRQAQMMDYVPYSGGTDDRYENGRSPPPTGMSDRSITKGLGKEAYVPTTFASYQGPNDVGARYEGARYEDPSMVVQPMRNAPQPSRHLPQRSAGGPEPGTQAILTPNRTRVNPPKEARHPYAIANNDYNDQDYDGEIPNVTHPQGGEHSASPSDISLGVLAKEVAKVLMKSSPSAGTMRTLTEDGDLSDATKSRVVAGTTRRERLNDNQDSAIDTTSRDTHSTAPPLYRNYQWEGAKLK